MAIDHDERHRYEQAYNEKRMDRAFVSSSTTCSLCGEWWARAAGETGVVCPSCLRAVEESEQRRKEDPRITVVTCSHCERIFEAWEGKVVRHNVKDGGRCPGSDQEGVPT